MKDMETVLVVWLATLVVLAVACGMALLLAWPVMWIWNAAFTEYPITYWQALCCFCIVRLCCPSPVVYNRT